MSELFENLLTSSPFAIIELFQLKLETAIHGSDLTHYFFSGVNQKTISGQIVYAGNTYIALPVEADWFEFKGDGTLPRPTLRIANTNSFVTAVLLSVNETTPGNDLTGAKVKRIRTLKKFLDGESAADPYATFPVEEWYVDRKVTESRDIVSFELASKFDLQGKELPNRQVVANICQWQYRSSECSYTGSSYFDVNNNSVSTLAQDACGKRLDSCKKRFGENNELPFGSFPGAGLTR
jgi:lambda family phage minor tail protein L